VEWNTICGKRGMVTQKSKKTRKTYGMRLGVNDDLLSLEFRVERLETVRKFRVSSSIEHETFMV